MLVGEEVEDVGENEENALAESHGDGTVQSWECTSPDRSLVQGPKPQTND